MKQVALSFVLDLMMGSARRARLELCSVAWASVETPTVGQLLVTRFLLKPPGGGRVGGQLKIFRKAVMKKLGFSCGRFHMFV